MVAFNEKNYIDGLVSVIIPVYNSEKFLEETVDSVLKQTYNEIEIICIDDKSTDNSGKLIDSLSSKYKNIIPIHLEENSGVATARNVGIENANGRYIAFLDSDDKWKEEKIEKQINFMKENDYAFTFTTYSFINENSKILNKKVKAKKEVSYKQMLVHNRISCLTVVIDRYKVDKINMPKIRHEDYATWLNIMRDGTNAYGLDEDLALYRSRGDSLSGNKLKAAKWTWNILRNVEHLNIVRASAYFTVYASVNVIKHFIKR